jgi:CubicO group peptidase (beta-lactamase class C family)
VWKVSEFLDLAAAQPPVFAPGTSFSYSNTDYTLLGLVIERITGQSWRHEVTRRVIRPLRLIRTELPAPGHRAIKGAQAHGYVELDGQTIDVRLDPSFPGPAGGYALVTTVQDLSRFLDSLFAGRLCRHRATLKQMLTLAPAQGEGRPRRLRHGRPRLLIWHATTLASVFGHDGPPEASRQHRSRASAQSSELRAQMVRTLTAFGPLGPCSSSYSTFAPSASDLNPPPAIAVWWTKRSLPPSSGLMKP